MKTIVSLSPNAHIYSSCWDFDSPHLRAAVAQEVESLPGVYARDSKKKKNAR